LMGHRIIAFLGLIFVEPSKTRLAMPHNK